MSTLDSSKKKAVAKALAPFTVLAAISTVPVPEIKNRGGSRSQFGFDTLEIGHSVGVVGRSAESLSTTVYNANKKYREPLRDTDGNIIYKTASAVQADGSKIQVKTSNPETRQTRKFIVVDVTADTDPEKFDGARIFRVALDQ